jgi:hypothetical protein
MLRHPLHVKNALLLKIPLVVVWAGTCTNPRMTNPKTTIPNMTIPRMTIPRCDNS